ncbi:MAG TPA: sigma-70 family RNA polymerase sigma factor [Candidatus Eisenbacteria bacterium]|nr:sigma-70 family RNA polymerase sigma factor [Candidatus Eisenbacteria bacterium]
MRSRLKEKFLLFRIRAKKDPEAFGAVYDAYVKQIYRFIYFKVSSAEQAEDLTSEAFLKAWQYLKEKRDVSNLQALLYSVARSVVIDHYRATNCVPGTVSLDESIGDDSTDVASEKFLNDMETKFDTTLVLEKLRGLKDEYRDVVIMRYLDEMSTGEIAAVLGKNASNVRVILHRATKALSAAIAHDRQRTLDNPQEDKE